MSEEERVREILQKAEKANSRVNELVFDKDSRSFRPSSPFADPDQVIPLNDTDGDLFCKLKGQE